MKQFSCGLVPLALLVVGMEKAKGQPSYLYTTLEGASANGINDNGQIVGTDNLIGGYLFSSGSYTTIFVPSPDPYLTVTTPSGISNGGLVVGTFFSRDLGNTWRGFQYSDNHYTLFAAPGSTNTFASGINTRGQIVGSYDSGGSSHGFLLSGGNYTTLDVPGSSSTGAYGINDHGQIVGSYSKYNPQQYDYQHFGFLLSGTSYTTVDFPGSSATDASGINNARDIVGTYIDARDQDHGFLLSDGNYYTIDVPGSVFTAIYGINDAGQIVGQYYDSGMRAHSFLATPTPEPSTLLLSSVATLGLIGWAWWRRRQTV